MKNDAFEELVSSLKESLAIRRGEVSAARTTVIEDPDALKIRSNYKMTQEEFSLLLGISVATLRNWEQGRRSPHGPAKVLLKIADRHPEALLDIKDPT